MLYLPLFILSEAVERVAALLLYPLAYALRRRVRTAEVLWPTFLYKPRFFLLWLLLDDSIEMETDKEYAGHFKFCPAWVWNTGSDFLRSYWWSAVRNACVNWNNYSAWKLGAFIEVVKSCGEVSFQTLRNYKRGYRFEYRRFTGGVRPYCEFYIFGRWNQLGWLNGSAARFEIDIMKDKR